MTTNSIPASQLVNVNPSVLSAGGLGIALNGMILTSSTRPPIAETVQFATAAAVSSYFGAASTEADAAAIYFNGFENSNIKPGILLFAQYNATAVSAYLRGGAVSGYTLAQLNAVSGSLVIVIDGYTHTSAAIDLSAATSFSNAASLINTALNTTQPTAAVVTGSITTTVLTVSAVTSGVLAVGQVISGTGITAGTEITALGTGTGGTGTYTVSVSQTATSTTVTAKGKAAPVTYDSTAGAFVVTSGITGVPSTMAFATGTAAAGLKFTSATGAVLSQGAAATTPSVFMAALINIQQNWATFMTMFDPDVTGNTNKLAFATWAAQSLNRYAYVCWDTDASPTTTVPATSSLGYLLDVADANGTILIYAPTATLGYQKAAFACGVGASIDFSERQGRTTFKFRYQSGLVADVTNTTVASNLIANFYNYYGRYATGADGFNIFAPGQITGQYLWADSYLNQIWLNNRLQLDLLNLLIEMKSIPYNTRGYGLIETSMKSTIEEALNFGCIATGVVLSSTQAANVKNAAGADIISALYTNGYYIQILPATAQVRAARTSPPCKLWYCDAGSVQQIDLSSIAIQ